MLSSDHVAALASAKHADPFSVLGMHAIEGGLWVRAMLPQASTVEVIDAATGRRAATLERRHEAGIFEGAVPRRRNRFAYRLRVTWDSGAQTTTADAYSFGQLLADADLHYFAEGLHLRPHTVLGAHPVELALGRASVRGIRFAVWAPNAKRVSVVGNFNAWDGRRHPMRSRGASGVWELFIPEVAEGDQYKFEITGADGNLLPLKADPYARAAQLRPDTASIVSGPLDCRRLPADRASRNGRNAPVSIYEVHAGSWRNGASGGFPQWDELAASLPAYAAGLGFTHIELMPVSEHPFDGSWGYQTLGMYAVSARFGPVEGFVRFVEACHAAGIGVLLDWVPAHFPADAHGLARFDGSALYEYADPREGFHRDWNTLIYNFGRNEVRNFLAGSALFWLERFGLDGLRVDAVASMLYRDYSRDAGDWIPNVHGGRENLEAISLLKRVNEIVGAECPGAVTLAEESTAFPAVSAPTYAGGLGFHFKWNMGWMNDTLRYMHEEPVHRQWHHSKMTFGLIYAFSENFVLPISHDEVVHGKGSMLSKMPGDDWQRFANLRAYYGFMWGHPGKKLLFMGQEFAQRTEWTQERALPWELLEDSRHSGVQRLVRDLNRAYCAQPALHQLDCEASGFEWLVGDDAQQSVFAWMRRDMNGAQVLVVANFTPVPRVDYRLGVPAGPGAWVELINTDALEYGGSGMGNGSARLSVHAIAAHGRPGSIQLTLPPLSTLFLVAA
jgi:1,4-alpha-glucan branching enzyme